MDSFFVNQEIVISPKNPKYSQWFWKPITGKKAKVFYGLAIPNGRR